MRVQAGCSMHPQLQISHGLGSGLLAPRRRFHSAAFSRVIETRPASIGPGSEAAGRDCGQQLMVGASAGWEPSQARETGAVGCIVGAVVIDENSQCPERRSANFRIEEHLQDADHRMINPYLGGRKILTLCRFTEQLRRISLTETHEMMCVCHKRRARPASGQFGCSSSRSRHGSLTRRDLCFQRCFRRRLVRLRLALYQAKFGARLQGGQGRVRYDCGRWSLD